MSSHVSLPYIRIITNKTEKKTDEQKNSGKTVRTLSQSGGWSTSCIWWKGKDLWNRGVL